MMKYSCYNLVFKTIKWRIITMEKSIDQILHESHQEVAGVKGVASQYLEV